ncbi:hypothetical protein FEE59_03075 [Herbaspirillum sp. RU 5E]|nr:hypothetical protein [Herbaspirillum sp. RU 5E]
MKVLWKVLLGAVGGALIAVFFLHPPSSSQDWAAWVQGVGSVAAIWFSVRISREAMSHSRQLEAERRAEESRERLMTVDALFSEIVSIVEASRKPFDDENYVEMAATSKVLHQDAKTALESLPLFEIKDASVVIQVLSVIRWLQRYIEKYDKAVNMQSLHDGHHRHPESPEEADDMVAFEALGYLDEFLGEYEWHMRAFLNAYRDLRDMSLSARQHTRKLLGSMG